MSNDPPLYPGQPGTPPAPLMAPPPSSPDKDASDLKMLSIFWYVLAGLKALASCIFLLYIGMGGLMMLVGGAAGAGSKEPVMAVPFLGMGAMVMCFGLIPLALLLTLAYLDFSVARALPLRQRLTFTQVMAGIECIFFPMGTALGVFTFILLSRPSIRASYG